MKKIVPILILALAGCTDTSVPPAADNAAASAAAQAGPQKGVDRTMAGKPAPDVAFLNPDGGKVTLAAMRGTPVLVNLWATWCAPCVKELPTLDRLAASHRNDGTLAVVAISQDTGSQAAVTAFLDKLKIKDLGAFHDPDMAVSSALVAPVLPVTILYGADGREIWRYTGEIDWSGPEAAKLLAEAKAPAAAD